MSPEVTAEPVDLPAQIRAIRLNDEKVLNQFYRKNFGVVEKYVLQNTGTSEQAKDIFQEAFIAVWRNIQLDRFQQQSATSLDAYLFRIAKNKWLDHLRSAGYRNTVPLQEQEPAAENNALHEAEDEQIRQLSKLVKQLGANCQDLLKRFYFGKESMRTIAAAFKWTETTARNNKYRCIQQLKELFNTNRHG